jgi:uncharacterized protein YkwD
MKRKFLLSLLVSVMLFIAVGSFNPAPMAQAALSPSELMAAVNALRASKGLKAYVVDNSLNASAQAHSQYQANLGTWTHQGPGGSTPKTRAIAAGFGGGATVFISENVAVAGTSAGVNFVIYDVWSDAIHWNTMTNPTYTHMGAGAVTKNGMVYYTLDVGYLASAPGSSSQATPGGQVQATQPVVIQNTVPPAKPIITVTAKPDGSVIHTVQLGQALWSIAIAYNVKIDDLLKLNKLLPSSIIYEGQSLVIQPSYTPSVTPTITQTSRPPTRTPTITNTPITPTITTTPTQTATPTPKPILSVLEDIDRRSLGLGILVVCALGVVMVVLGSLRKKAS